MKRALFSRDHMRQEMYTKPQATGVRMELPDARHNI